MIRTIIAKRYSLQNELFAQLYLRSRPYRASPWPARARPKVAGGRSALPALRSGTLVPFQRCNQASSGALPVCPQIRRIEDKQIIMPASNADTSVARIWLSPNAFATGLSAPLKDRWWSQTGSNRRPHACKARALPTELWPQYFLPKAKNATHRQMIATIIERCLPHMPGFPILIRQSHAFGCAKRFRDRSFNCVERPLVGRGGLEPPTSRLSGVRSNHLSYRPISLGTR